jgi:hypothetical protein
MARFRGSHLDLRACVSSRFRASRPASGVKVARDLAMPGVMPDRRGNERAAGRA